mgnify:CR=1 FL=1
MISIGAPVLRRVTIGTSRQVTVLNATMIDEQGLLQNGGAASRVFGHIDAIQELNGVGVETTGLAGAASGSFVGSFDTSATNPAVAQVSAVCDVSKYSLYSADPDATIATTVGSNLLGIDYAILPAIPY